MTEHFISTLIVEGSKEDIDKFYNDFRASAVLVKGREALCICQYVDPLPPFIFSCKGCVHKGEQRPLTHREQQILDQSMSYMRDYWGVTKMCQDGRLRRINDNKAEFRYWTPRDPVADRILILLHNKHPNTRITLTGYNELFPEIDHVEKELPRDFPIVDEEKLNKLYENSYQKRYERFVTMFAKSQGCE